MCSFEALPLLGVMGVDLEPLFVLALLKHASAQLSAELSATVVLLAIALIVLILLKLS